MVWWFGGLNFKKRIKRSVWEVLNKVLLVLLWLDVVFEVIMVIFEGGMRG